MEHIDNPMTMYFPGDEFNPESPFFIDIDGLPTDRPEWEEEYDERKEPQTKVCGYFLDGMPRLGYSSFR